MSHKPNNQILDNQFLAGLKSGKPQIGLWVSLANPTSAEAIASAGFDWVLVDMEHSPNDLRSVVSQLQVFAAYNTTAIVRPEWNDAVLVKRLLDCGAEGLLFPMVQNLDEAKAAVASTRYPPNGIRGVSLTHRGNNYGRISDYLTQVEDETAVLLQVETRAALEAAEDIASADGVDGVFFGPADIAADMGLLGQPQHPDVWAAIRPVAERLMAKGIPVGTLVADPEFARSLIADGFLFVACGSDAGLLARSADHLIAIMRS